MLTVLESIKLSTDFLEKKGIDSPRLNAELLLAEIMNCQRLDLYLKFDQPLKDNEVDKYREWIARRSKYEPLQYIIGKMEFFGIPLNVTSDVLIPRPETEILVETVINNHKDQSGLKILDVGIGSGNISIALAKNLKDCEITGIDISENAIQIAKENILMNDCASRINLLKSDVSQYSSGSILYDAIVSNPPYVCLGDFVTLQKEITEYEPRYAVTDENDGLSFYRVIAEKSNHLLRVGGMIYAEIAKGQTKDVENILAENNFKNINFVKDLQQIERVVVGEKK